MKKIALTQRILRNEHTGEIRDALDHRWAPFLATLDLMPVAMPTAVTDPAAWLNALGIHGVILTGGNDLAQVADDDLSRQRDAFEAHVIDWAASRRIPLLGVCRGAQMLAHHFGGHVTATENHAGTRHSVSALGDSPRATLIAGRGDVPSYHDYGIADLSAALTPLAADRQGLIEAFEHPGLPILGLMWHPEREAAPHPVDRDLIADLFQ